MNDEDDTQRLPTTRAGTAVVTSSDSQLPEMGGIVNRWLDHFRTLDNNARMVLVRSLTNRINAEGELVDAYVSFEKKKRQLIQLDEILEDEDDELRFQREERQHQRELRRRERERELNPQNSERYQKKRGPNREERLRSEADSIVQHGTFSDRGKIADASIAEIKSQYGDDENSWPEDVRENVRRLRIWKLKDA